MSEKYFLAVDIGASSGRHILGHIENGKLILEEIHRFFNGASMKGDKFCWDIERLFLSVVEGLKKCKQAGKIPYSMGIDTWGVDYALLDKNDKLIGEVYSYRDGAVQKLMGEIESLCPREYAYSRTGIFPQVYNTVNQLYRDKKNGKLDNAETMLFVPDYLAFLLTGKKNSEYSIASTSGLINATTREWDNEIIEKLGLKKSVFRPLCVAGTVVGNLKKEIAEEVGFDTKVVFPPSHDTASAVLAVTETVDPLYISSGTWSLMGIETRKENTSEEALKAGFTNEGGWNKSIRFLKNIMGLWMVQCIKKELNDEYSFGGLVDEARKCADFKSIVDVNDMRFFAPASMIEAVKGYCREKGEKVPESVGEIVFCVYNSLAKSYAETVKEIEKITGKTYSAINIVGGGCQNVLLNELTEKETGKKVVAGPIEATATGNILAQMISSGTVKDADKGKALIKKSFDIK